ncbi:hypothetical protein MtrunA17_Chr4g0032861 [Medicago truncatula]|uniref:Transmembrane protein n=1 Tax=Medicago truncatula TaxID=3880 RepID=A0A396I639_MEDTR|nr:hypothetical protein MtrunA17_Chr4g0032861 [Medicago truncatula]
MGICRGSFAAIPNGGFVTGQYPSSMLMNMNGFNNHPFSLMNMLARHAMQQQPQMMYYTSPFLFLLILAIIITIIITTFMQITPSNYSYKLLLCKSHFISLVGQVCVRMLDVFVCL